MFYLHSLNPDAKSGLQEGIKKFGLMPSQKENASKAELELIANWMVDDLHMSKKITMKIKRSTIKNKKRALALFN